MKIAIDLTPLADNFSGIERYALCMAREMILAEAPGVSYLLLFKGEVHPAFAPLLRRENVSSRVLRPAGRLRFSQISLPLCLYRAPADVYLFLAFPAPLLFLSRRSVSAIHDLCCFDFPKTMKWQSVLFFRTLFQRAAWLDRGIVTVSRFSKARILARYGLPGERVCVAHSAPAEIFLRAGETGLPTGEAVRQKYGLPSAYILSLSTLEPRKNLRLLIDAYASLCREGAMDYGLVLAGRKGWLLGDLLAGIDPQIAGRIHITGFVQDEDLPALYAGAKLFVFPSLYEGFGLPPLEALAAGCPVLSSDAASLPEVLGDGAVYFQSGNLQDLKEKLQAMLHGGAGPTAEARARVVAQYRFEDQAGRLLRFLKA